MIDKKRMIPMIISASALSVFAIGCVVFNNSEIVFNEEKVTDIKKAKDDNSFDKYRYTYTENTDTLKNYDKLELISYNANLDEDTLHYNISLEFRNLSKKALNNLNIEFKILGPESGISVETVALDTLDGNGTFTCDISVSKDNLLSLVNNDMEEADSVVKSVISDLVNNQGIGLMYTYNYADKESFDVEYELNYDGTVYNKSVYSTTLIDEDLKSTHVDNGSYLNLVKPEDKYKNNIVETQSVQVDIDKDFNFTIKAKFKNISNKSLDAFRFTPYIIIGDTYAPDSLNRKIETRDSIKAGEEFEISVTYDKDVIKDSLQYVNKNAIGATFYKDEDKLLRYIVEHRLVSINYTYDYENTEMAASVSATMSRSGKLDIMKIYEYDINQNSEDLE